MYPPAQKLRARNAADSVMPERRGGVRKGGGEGAHSRRGARRVHEAGVMDRWCDLEGGLCGPFSRRVARTARG